MTQVRAAVSRNGTTAIETVTFRDLEPGEILVRVEASGICATDRHGIANHAEPAIYGHEGAGVAAAVGAGVTAVTVGDHVVMGFDSCGRCDSCRGGHPASCARFAALNFGTRDDIATDHEGRRILTGWMAQSAWATFAVARERNVVVIDREVPFAVAASLACGVLTGAGTIINVIKPQPADTVVVIGGGTTGLAAIMAAHHRRVGTIAVIEPREDRRALALTVGATHIFAPTDDVPFRAHAVIDSVGSSATTAAALGLLRPGGEAITIALHAGENNVTVSQSRLLWGRRIAGVIEGDADLQRDVPALLALWRCGRLPVEALIRTYAFDDCAQALADSGSVVKAVLEPHGRHELPAPRATVPLAEALQTMTQADLAAVWRTLPSVAPHELRGLWRGVGLSPQHPTHDLLERSGWFGKLFRSDDDVAPIVVERAGVLSIDRSQSNGGAVLRTMTHEGITTAAMIYEYMPIIDLFVRVDATTVLGVMTGKHAEHHGELYYFLLTASDRTVD